jgi:coenzyme PQQ biosynthesis protein C
MTAARGIARCPWDAAEFEQQLRAKGQAYHIHHPFNVMLNAGRASREQVRGWVANRFYYQINIPRKDAAILANCPDREQRREWVQRILDHDGTERIRVASRPGCGWARRWALRARSCGRSSTSCRECASRSTPM